MTTAGISRTSKNLLPIICKREWASDFRQSGFGRSVLTNRLRGSRKLHSHDFKAHYGCVNAIEFSNERGELILSGGDDRRVLVWNVQKAMSDIGEPTSMKAEHNSNIFCVAFSIDNNKIFSGGNDEQVIVHDANTGETLDVYMHEDSVYGVSVDPSNVNVFASACDDGRILIYDIREPASTDPFCLANYTSSMHAVMFNPMEPRLLATANAKEGLGLWDIRKPKTCCLRYGGGSVQQSCMSVRISQSGDKIIALRRRLPPVLYYTHSPDPVCEFDHSGYYNSCTMKSCCFAGYADEYVLSGSDDFNLYMWKIPQDLSYRRYTREPHVILKGHRSIVNQVRSNPSDNLIISSGVEKVVKIWSPFPITSKSPDLNDEDVSNPDERVVYTPEEYINLVLRSGHISHVYVNQSTEEDPRMLAFFDSLVQAELDMSSDELSSDEELMYERILQVTRSEVEHSLEDGFEDLSSSDSGDESDFSPFSLAFASFVAAQNEENGRHSILLDSDQAVASSEDSRSQVNRRSIGEIITQNRKEVLKAMEENKKSGDGSSKAGCSWSCSSDPDSLDSGSDSELKRKDKCKFMKTSTRHLKRLNVLRNHALNSDSEGSDTNVPLKRNRIDFKTILTDVEPLSDRKEDKMHNCVKDLHESSFGPNSHENELVVHTNGKTNGNIDQSNLSINKEKSSDSIPCSTSHDCKNDVVDNLSSINLDSTGINKGKSLFKRRNKVGKGDVSDCIPSTSTCDPVGNIKGKSLFKKRNNVEKNYVSGCLPSTSTCDSVDDNNKGKSLFKRSNNMERSNNVVEQVGDEDVTVNESNSQNSQPVWTEFKRFKNRLERARRYYRKHSGSQVSSDDD